MGSAWVRSLTSLSTGNIIVISDLTPVEIFSVFERQKRNRALRAAQVSVLQSHFLTHYRREYLSVTLDTLVLVRARDLVTRYKLWALDAVQLACAVEFENIFGDPVTFISADNDLLMAAQGEGFTTDNPLSYP